MLVKARIKSLFVLPAALVSTALAAIAAAMALRGNFDSLAWWGACLASLALPLLFARIALLKPARTADNEPLALLISSVGLLLAAWEVLIEGAAGWLPLVFAGAGTLVLLFYVFWYSRFGRIASGKLDVGNRLPEFSLSDVDGKAVNSRELLGSPAVLMFYRGNWCPLCVAQVDEIAARYRELDGMGVTVTLISPQPASDSRKLAARHDTGIRFWVDRSGEVARDLDIGVDNGVPLGVPGRYHARTVMPTVVVTNQNGTILYSDQTDNYRVRPEPDTFIAILRRAGAMT